MQTMAGSPPPLIQVKCQRVLACLGGHEIDLQVPGVGVGVGRRRPPGSHGKGMHPRADAPFTVDRFTVVGNFVKVLATPLAGEIDMVVPKRHASRFVDTGSNFDHRCGAESVEKELLLPAPHWTPKGGWVDAQRVALSPSTEAKAAWGSMGAWDT